MLDKKNVIPAEILQQIEERINEELTKRCFPTVEIELEGELDIRFKFQSEPFNTVPALVKSIVIKDWSTGTFLHTENIVDKDGDVQELESVGIFIGVHASYEHWGGGRNGCDVFAYRAQMWENSHGDAGLGRETIE